MYQTWTVLLGQLHGRVENEYLALGIICMSKRYFVIIVMIYYAIYYTLPMHI